MSRHRAIEALVKHWLEMDRDEGTRAEIEQLWQQNRLDELDIRLQNSKSGMGGDEIHKASEVTWCQDSPLVQRD